MKYKVTLKSETVIEIDAYDEDEAIKTAIYYPMYGRTENMVTISDKNTAFAEELQEVEDGESNKSS
ncbi:hypothetical protein BCR22_07265 [Enterococcus plantarum]|uniref:hypothetical protein n=1 Tax=Enterococcus plantarum TaxID=1077675 RepID=UPI00084DC5C8|nr:hypothetical protein [Enterococcus plantarum]OEG09385.1 hypothetical protein BCR22_07265 [Enterococcus plantarum]